MKPFIDMNIDLRKKATVEKDTFGQDLYKAANNHVYGKTLEQVRDRRQYKLVPCRNDQDAVKYRIRKLIATNTFVRSVPVGNSMFVCEVKKRVCSLEQPIYLGNCILDLSKKHMYNCWYNIFMPRFGPERLKLCYMDTDSFFIHFLNTKNLLCEMKELEEDLNGRQPITRAGQGVFDFSSLDPKLDPEYFNPVNQKEPFMFKIETGSHVIKEFVALRAKMYSYKVMDRHAHKTKVHKKAKGIPGGCHDSLNFDECLQTGVSQYCSFTRIASKEKQNYTATFTKKSLTGPLHNDKRVIYVYDNEETRTRRFETFAIGHYKTF
jgi:hypothetical protein